MVAVCAAAAGMHEATASASRRLGVYAWISFWQLHGFSSLRRPSNHAALAAARTGERRTMPARRLIRSTMRLIIVPLKAMVMGRSPRSSIPGRRQHALAVRAMHVERRQRGRRRRQCRQELALLLHDAVAPAAHAGDGCGPDHDTIRLGGIRRAEVVHPANPSTRPPLKVRESEVPDKRRPGGDHC